MRPINLKRLIIAIAIPEAVGALSSLVSGRMGETYQNYVKPPLSPPGWLFPVVWVILFALMGIASYLIFDEPRSREKREALFFYGLQLLVNFIWSPIFFRFEAYWLAVVVLVVLISLVVVTMIRFKLLNSTAFYLLIPYLIWLIFALYLNIGVALLN